MGNQLCVTLTFPVAAVSGARPMSRIHPYICFIVCPWKFSLRLFADAGHAEQFSLRKCVFANLKRFVEHSVTQAFLPWRTPKMIFLIIPRNPCLWGGGEVKRRRLLDCFQLSHKTFRDISRCVYNLFWYFKIVTYLYDCFSREPLTIFGGTLRFRGTLFERHWCSRMEFNA